MVRWFILRNENIKGPFSTEEIKSLNQSGDILDKDLIWGNLQAEWKPVAWWNIELPKLLAQTPKEEKETKLWHYAIQGQSFGPFNREDLIAKLKDNKSNYDILVWTKGMKAWAPIFEFTDLLDAVGINKRQFPRADIDGKVTIKSGPTTIVGNLLMISEGGFGADQIKGLSNAQIVSVEIESDSFYESIHAKAEVRYMTERGYVGFKFQNINMESRSAIVQYVKSAGRTFVKAA